MGKALRTIVIGLGNPILSDDSVGIKVAAELKHLLRKNDGIDVIELYAGGINLMDAMTGYDKAIVVDAMLTGVNKPGTVKLMSVSKSNTTKNIVSSHDSSLLTALEVGRSIGLSLPLLSCISVVGIEAKETEVFGYELSAEVSLAVPVAVKQVMAELQLRG
jgi:hydrogenase maturation protease